MFTAIQLGSFINRISFKDSDIILRMVGGDLLVEEYEASAMPTRTIKCHWTVKQSQTEWDNMSKIGKKIIKHGNPTILLKAPRNYHDSSSTYALVSFPTGSVRFWKNEDDSFYFELRYAFRRYCHGLVSKNGMNELKSSFQRNISSIIAYGRELDRKEQNEIIDPQMDYIETGEENTINIQGVDTDD